MLSRERTAALAEILTLTINESEAAARGSWEEVRSMDRRRLELLTDFFAAPLAPGERDALSEQFEALVAEDRRLLETAREARRGVAGSLRQERRQREAAALYRSVGEGRGVSEPRPLVRR